MRQIESVRARMAGEPTFNKRRLTISNMLTSLAHGLPLQVFADDYDIHIDCCKDALRDIAEHLYKWMRPEVQWELWSSEEENSTTFSTSSGITNLFAQGLMPPDSKREWIVMARSTVDAQEKLHEHMEWEPYKPMLQENGEPYPEDMGDTVITNERANRRAKIDIAISKARSENAYEVSEHLSDSGAWLGEDDGDT